MPPADRWRNAGVVVMICCVLLLGQGCAKGADETAAPAVPRGYLPVLEIEAGDRLLGFGPFVGYYFKPERFGDMSRLRFVCYNARRFYAADAPENALLFRGEAVLVHLPESDIPLPQSHRINPIFFSGAPSQWLESRPEPKDEYVHFHSCYDSSGPVRTGYWIRHEALRTFTYDMGGRVGSDSPLYHGVRPGIDKGFARIIEFDRGPDSGR